MRARGIDPASPQADATRLPAPTSGPHDQDQLAMDVGAVAPGFIQLSRDVILADLWRRSDLSLRDRSLVTIVAIAAAGNSAQLPDRTRHGVANGLNREQVSEALTHLGFYAGWRKATAALAIVADTLSTGTTSARGSVW